MSDRRLMFVHAHPDDESSQSPATMSRYVDEGAQVTLVTCTLGELGEILVPEWEHCSPSELGAHRVDELTKALEIVGVTDHVWLGGMGRYHDSGMTTDDEGRAIPCDELPDGAFWAADLLEASDHLVALIRDRRPQVVATYDEKGNYGHPDHIQAHRVTMYATLLAGVSSYRPDLGESWRVSRVLWISHNPQAWFRALEKARELGMPLAEGLDEAAMRRRFAIDPRHIVAVIPYAGRADLCQAALEAHRSQVDPENPLWKMFRFMRTVEGAGEAYRLAVGVPFPGDGPADDLFAGLDVRGFSVAGDAADAADSPFNC